MVLLLLSAIPLYAQMPRLSLSERIEMSELVVVAYIDETYKGEGEDEAVGNWFAECNVKEVLRGTFEEEKIKVNYKNVRRRKKSLTPIRLQEGSDYLLFLRKNGNVYQMFSSFQGAFQQGNTYSIYDEALGRRNRSISVSYNEILERVRELLEERE